MLCDLILLRNLKPFVRLEVTGMRTGYGDRLESVQLWHLSVDFRHNPSRKEFVVRVQACIDFFKLLIKRGI